MRGCGFGVVVIVAGVGGVASGGGITPFPLFQPRTVAVGTDIVPADIDGDGDVDFVALSAERDRLYWLESDGGDFPEFGMHEIASGLVGAEAPFVADFTGDGMGDVVVFERGTGKLLLFPDCAGTGIVITLNADIDIARAADMDGDGDTDVVVGSGSGGLWWVENGGGQWTDRVISPSLAVFDLDLGDVDGDGADDLLVGSGNGVQWRRNDGGGVWVRSFAITNDAGENYARFGDLNGDGVLDVCSMNPQRRLEWRAGDGTGFASTPNSLQGTNDPSIDDGFFALADFDNDGDLDVFMCDRNGFGPSIRENLGGSTPEFGFASLPDRTLRRSSVADVDGDGDLDIIGTEHNISFFDSPVACVVYEQLEVVNLNSGSLHRRLEHAILGSDQHDTILADAGLFALEPVIDFAGRRIEVMSAEGIDRPIIYGESGVYLTDGATLSTSEGYDLRTRDFTLLSDGSEAEVASGGALEFRSSIYAGDHSALLLRGDSFGMERGELSLGFQTDVIIEAADAYLSDRSSMSIAAGSVHFETSGRAVVECEFITLQSNSVISATGDLAFSPPIVFESEDLNDAAWHRAVAMGDLTGDGVPDVAASREMTSDGTAVVWHDVSDAQAGERVIIEDDRVFLWMAIGDADGDGDNDLFARWMRVSGQFGVSVFRNVGEGVTSFSEVVIYETASGLFTPDSAGHLGDMDADGDLDVLVLFGPHRFLLENSGGGDLAFTRRDFLSESVVARFAAVGDFDGDSDQDVVVSLNSLGGVAWLENQGDLGAAFAVHVISDDRVTGNFAPGDFDSDGDLDFLFFSGNVVKLAVNDGADPPSFELRTVHDFGQYASVSSVFVADIDRDGDPDVGYVGGWLENVDAEIFRPRRLSNLGTTGTVWGLAAEDLDGDRLPEVVAALQFGLDLFRPIAPALASDRSNLHVSAGGGLRLENITLLASDLAIGAGDGVLLDQNSAIRALKRVDGDLVASGVIAHGRALPLGIAGSLTLTETLPDGEARTGSYEVEAVTSTLGVVSSTQIDVSGDAALAGALTFTSGQENFNPPVGTVFPILQAGSISSPFDVAYFPGFSDGRYLRLVYDFGGAQGDEEGARGAAMVSVVVDTLTGQIDLGPELSFETSGQAAAATLGEFNGDGLVDLAIALPDSAAPMQSPGSVVVLFNGGVASGQWLGFSGGAQFPIGAINPTGLAAAELDDDKDLDDIAVIGQLPGAGADGGVFLLSNSGGSFTERAVFNVGRLPSAIIAADLSGDGRPDLAVANASDNDVSVLINGEGSGPVWEGFVSRVDYGVGARPRALLAAELDGAEGMDLAIANEVSDTLTALFNDGAGAFPARADVALAQEPIALAAGDLDLDGDMDLVALCRADGEVSIVLSRRVETGQPTFSPSIDLTLGAEPSSIAAVDLDGDGDLDLAAVIELETGLRDVAVLRNDLNGSQLGFAPSESLGVNASPLFVLAADVNGDGDEDLITVNDESGSSRSAGGVSVVRNFGSCPDADGDGLVGMSDLNAVLVGWGGAGAQPGDVNGDGLVNFTDLNSVLVHFDRVCD